MVKPTNGVLDEGDEAVDTSTIEPIVQQKNNEANKRAVDLIGHIGIIMKELGQ